MLQGWAGSQHTQDRHGLCGWAKGNFPASSAGYSPKPKPQNIASIGTVESCAGAEACFSRDAWGNPQNFPESMDHACNRHGIDSHTKKEDLLGQSKTAITVLPLQLDTVVYTLKNKRVN